MEGRKGSADRKRTKAVESRDEGMAVAAFPLQPFSSMMQDSLHGVLPYPIKIPVQVGFCKKKKKKKSLIILKGKKRRPCQWAGETYLASFGDRKEYHNLTAYKVKVKVAQ